MLACLRKLPYAAGHVARARPVREFESRGGEVQYYICRFTLIDIAKEE